MPSKSLNKQLASYAPQVLVLVSLVAFGVMLYGLDWAKFFSKISDLDLAWIPLMMVAMLLSVMLRALRWQIMLGGREQTRFSDCLDATFLGFLASTVLPLRAGEFARPYLFSRFSKTSFSQALASIIVERACDVLCLLLFIGVLFPIAGVSLPNGAEAVVASLALVAAVILVILAISVLKETLIRRIAQKIFDRLPKSIGAKGPEILENFLSGLRGIKSLRQLVLVVGLSVAIWVAMGIFFQCGFYLFGFDEGFVSGQITNLTIALAVAAPSAPGFIGTFHLGCFAALTLFFGYSDDIATTYALIIHAINMLFNGGAGAWASYKRGLSLSELRGSSKN